MTYKNSLKYSLLCWAMKEADKIQCGWFYFGSNYHTHTQTHKHTHTHTKLKINFRDSFNDIINDGARK